MVVVRRVGMALKASLGMGLLAALLLPVAGARQQDPAKSASPLAVASSARSLPPHSTAANGAAAVPAKPATWRLGRLTLTAC